MNERYTINGYIFMSVMLVVRVNDKGNEYATRLLVLHDHEGSISWFWMVWQTK